MTQLVDQHGQLSLTEQGRARAEDAIVVRPTRDISCDPWPTGYHARQNTQPRFRQPKYALGGPAVSHPTSSADGARRRLVAVYALGAFTTVLNIILLSPLLTGIAETFG